MKLAQIYSLFQSAEFLNLYGGAAVNDPFISKSSISSVTSVSSITSISSAISHVSFFISFISFISFFVSFFYNVCLLVVQKEGKTSFQSIGFQIDKQTKLKLPFLNNPNASVVSASRRASKQQTATVNYRIKHMRSLIKKQHVG